MTRIRNFIVNVFIGGVIVLLPIIIIFQIAQWLFTLFKESTRPLTEYMTSTFSISQPLALMLSLIGIFTLFSIIGMIVRTQIGSGLYQFLENMTLSRIPGYKTIKDIVAQITGKQKGLFRKVVLIKVGNTGVAATGFVVDEISEDYSSVFIPCGPNPTTGFILHIKNEDISVMNISVETAMKTIIACGSGSSQFINAEKLQSSLDKKA
jgi:uncharacterized membrane protein